MLRRIVIQLCGRGTWISFSRGSHNLQPFSKDPKLAATGATSNATGEPQLGPHSIRRIRKIPEDVKSYAAAKSRLFVDASYRHDTYKHLPARLERFLRDRPDRSDIWKHYASEQYRKKEYVKALGGLRWLWQPTDE